MSEITNIIDNLNSMTEDSPVIYTGFQSFDRSIGGLAEGSIIDLRGETGSGKTSFVYSVIKENLDKNILYIDTKNSFVPSFCIKNNIDLSKFYIANTNSIEKIYYILKNALLNKSVDIVISDDIANIVLERDEMLSPGTIFKKIYKQVLQMVSKSRCILIVVNQNREIDNKVYYIAQKSLNEICKYIIYFKKQAILRYRNEYIGCRVKISVEKPCVDLKDFTVDIFYNRGIDEILNLVEFLLKNGSITKSGSWLYYREKCLGHGIYNSVIALSKDQTTLNSLIREYDSGR
jgi:RecA/RadA recombinase